MFSVSFSQISCGKLTTYGLVTIASSAVSGQPNEDLGSLSAGVYQGSQSNLLSTTDCSHESYPILVTTSNLRRFHRRHIALDSNQANLCYPTFSIGSEREALGALWNHQSAVTKADTISAYVSLQSLVCRLRHLLALTETWITPETNCNSS